MRGLTLLAAAAALTWAAPAAAQTYWHHPIVEVTSAVNKHSGLRDPSAPDNRMYLFRQRSGGIDQKVWSGSTSTTSWPASWTPRTNADVVSEATYGTGLAAAAGEYWNSGYGLWMPRFQSFYDYRNGAGNHRLGAPFWNWLDTAYNWLSLTPPNNGNGPDFQPWSTITWKNGTAPGSALRMNVFGLTFDRYDYDENIIDYTSLREAWFDGGTWRFTDHGRPRPDVVELIRMGPHSAAWTNPHGVGRGYVFVSGNDGYNSHRLFVNYFGPGCSGTATGWCWTDLGEPEGTVEMRTPVAVTYPNGSGGTRVAVFVAVKTGSRWNLWGRYTDDRVSFSNWQNHGNPSNLQYSNYTTAGFDLSVGVVFYMGGVMRINLFGTSEPYDVASSGLTAHGGGQLIEYFWDGATWRWGQVEQPGPVHFWNVQDERTQWTPCRFQTMSASVVDTQAWERIGVFGKDECGATWERSWSANGWTWIQH